MIKLLMAAVSCLFILTGCAISSSSGGGLLPSAGADQAAEAFFDHWKKADAQGAYELFARPLAQAIPFDNFRDFLKTAEDQWGRLEDDETAVMPFHQRAGEGDLIAPDISADQIRRYIFNLRFDNAEVNCDLTLVPEGGGYKITWFSFWGSNSSMTPELREKMEHLFWKPVLSDQK